MRNRMYGGVRGRKMKVGGKLLHFPPTRLLVVFYWMERYRLSYGKVPPIVWIGTAYRMDVFE